MSISNIRQTGDEQLLVNFRVDKVFSEVTDDFVTKEFIRIAIPGDKHTVIDTIVTPEYAKRFHAEYNAFKRHSEAGMPEGMPLEDWGHLNQYQIAELKVMNIMTVQQLANLSDGQVQRIGMGGLQLRDAARKRVGTKDHADEIEALKSANAEMAKQMADLMELIKSGVSAAPLAIDAAANYQKRGPGRPPKEA